MRGRWQGLNLGLALGCAVLALFGALRHRTLDRQADLAQQRSISAGQSFVDTFAGEYVDEQLGTLDQRRALLLRASAWRQTELFALVGMVFFAFAAYTLGTIEPLTIEDETLPGNAARGDPTHR